MLEIIELYCDDNVYSNSKYLYLLCKINQYYLCCNSLSLILKTYKNNSPKPPLRHGLRMLASAAAGTDFSDEISSTRGLLEVCI